MFKKKTNLCNLFIRKQLRGKLIVDKNVAQDFESREFANFSIPFFVI